MFQRANVGISDELHKHFGNFFIFNSELPPPVDHTAPFTKGKARLHECFSIEKRSVFATETLVSLAKTLRQIQIQMKDLCYFTIIFLPLMML